MITHFYFVTVYHGDTGNFTRGGPSFSPIYCDQNTLDLVNYKLLGKEYTKEV